MRARIYTKIDAVHRNTGVMHVRFIKAHTLLQVGARSQKLADINQDRAESARCRHEERRIFHALRESEELLRQSPGGLELTTHHVVLREPPQNREELSGLSDALTECSRAGIGALDFRSGIAVHGCQRRAERTVEQEFFLDSFRRLREYLEQRQTL